MTPGVTGGFLMPLCSAPAGPQEQGSPRGLAGRPRPSRADAELGWAGLLGGKRRAQLSTEAEALPDGLGVRKASPGAPVSLICVPRAQHNAGRRAGVSYRFYEYSGSD